mmetsp:Transcript_25278/g.41138  ORF Transcript_25278/g.41138 Transcript_25278/m.41138 type:complete len:341 (+) Transcript_25278:755-1777(+)
MNCYLQLLLLNLGFQFFQLFRHQIANDIIVDFLVLTESKGCHQRINCVQLFKLQFGLQYRRLTLIFTLGRVFIHICHRQRYLIISLFMLALVILHLFNLSLFFGENFTSRTQRRLCLLFIRQSFPVFHTLSFNRWRRRYIHIRIQLRFLRLRLRRLNGECLGQFLVLCCVELSQPRKLGLTRLFHILRRLHLARVQRCLGDIVWVPRSHHICSRHKIVVSPWTYFAVATCAFVVTREMVAQPEIVFDRGRRRKFVVIFETILIVWLWRLRQFRSYSSRSSTSRSSRRRCRHTSRRRHCGGCWCSIDSIASKQCTIHRSERLLPRGVVVVRRQVGRQIQRL